MKQYQLWGVMASVKGKFSTDMEVGHINGDHIQVFVLSMSAY